MKDNALRWFMSLGGGTFTNWDRMKQVFLEKYQEYCNTKDKREELFKMVQRDDESLEYFVERNLKTTTKVKLDVTEAQKRRLNQLNELDEKRLATVDKIVLIQQ